MSQGMHCCHCGGTDWKIKETEPYAHKVVRSRICRNCGTRIQTTEVQFRLLKPSTIHVVAESLGYTFSVSSS